MTPFTFDQWIMLALIFVLGLLVGMFLMAGGKWKRLYREETERTRALEAQNKKLKDDAREMASLRAAAVKAPGNQPDETGATL
jgi:uncharacterized membrane-anchored protein YhcB (DUF1043 family)